jgi:hypothetical protein
LFLAQFAVKRARGVHQQPRVFEVDLNENLEARSCHDGTIMAETSYVPHGRPQIVLEPNLPADGLYRVITENDALALVFGVLVTKFIPGSECPKKHIVDLVIREAPDSGVEEDDVFGGLLAKAVPGATDLGFFGGRQEGKSLAAPLLDAQSENVVEAHMVIPSPV